VVRVAVEDAVADLGGSPWRTAGAGVAIAVLLRIDRAVAAVFELAGGERPSLALVLWSSHCSGGSAARLILPSPHIDGVQSPLQVAGVCESHGSPLSTRPLPELDLAVVQQPSLSAMLLCRTARRRD
jgi:hypothetical protein